MSSVMMSASSVAVSIRIALFALLLLGATFLVARHPDEVQNILPRILKSLSIQNTLTGHGSPQQVMSQPQPFQLRLNDKYLVSRYLRHQPEYGASHNALTVVFSETEEDEPLLFTIHGGNL